jgi:hypothetical protein
MIVKIEDMEKMFQYQRANKEVDNIDILLDNIHNYEFAIIGVDFNGIEKKILPVIASTIRKYNYAFRTLKENVSYLSEFFIILY